MGAAAVVHPTDQTLQSYGLGKLDDLLSESVNKHLESCSDCRRRAAELSSDSFLGRIQKARAPTDNSAAAWSPEVSPTAPDRAAPNQRPAAETMPPGLAEHPDYEVIRELGRGGMGVVYLAHNRLLGRDEVLKVMAKHIMERPGLLARFQAEMRAVARLQHPNIVTAYSAFRLGESILFAMEYVEGLDLAKMVKTKGPLPVAHACYFVNQAAQGMQHAHERGMVHRDIKPGNLMLSHQGDRALVKILDFGLAKATREAPVDGGLTNPGQALGTPDYMAPEQIRDAQKADIRADIYSLGCTLYYLLSGGPPFHAKNLWDLYQSHHSIDAKLLNFVRPEVPSELASLVAKMMAKQPERRFQTPAEVAQALTPFFKKGNARASNVEVSQVEQPATELESVGVSSPSIQPTPKRAPTPPVEKPAVKVASENRWESLIEFKETEPLREPAPAVVKKGPQEPRWLWPAVAASLLLLGLIVTLAAIVVRVNTTNGTIVLDGETALDGIVSREGPPAVQSADVAKVPRQAEPAEQSVASRESWVSLFDGETLSGWTTADGSTGKWKVEDGALTCSGPASHLFSPRGDYKNFRYRAEIKINDRGNSGQYFRTRKGPGFPKGYEAQVNSTHGDRIKTGSLYGLVNVMEILVPPNTWFTQEVEAVGNHIVIKVNDKITVDYIDPKNTFTEGHFAFQHHDPRCHVQIRKIEVIELTGLKVGSNVADRMPATVGTSKTTASGLIYRDVNAGTGKSPEYGQTCVVHYTGWLWENNAKGNQFDSSLDKGKAFEFQPYKKKVIAGWDEGVSTMKVGGLRQLWIPPDLGYGARGAGGGVIPPNATLFFEIELLDVK